MVWTCHLCTFENRDDGARKCEICETKRQGCNGEESTSDEGRAKRPKATVQMTLFGKALSKEEQGQTKKRKLEKKKPEEDSQPAPSLQQSSLFSTEQSARTKNVPFDVLKERTKTVMKEKFKIRRLRALQPVAVEGALKGQSQLIVMATGGGKSLCYQLPAVVLGGTSIVVSPLIALMQDQVQSLLSKGIQAAVISSANGARHNEQVLQRLLGKRTKHRAKPSDETPLLPINLLYCTPEQIQTVRFRSIIQRVYDEGRLSLVAVDEAHCLSLWGHGT